MEQESKASFGVRIPFIEHLGISLRSAEGGRSTLDFTPGPEHCNSFQVTHGGALMSMLDVTMATAARSVEPGMGCVTIEMKTNFMRPAKGALRAEGHLMHRTGTMAFVEGTVYDERGHACAHATGTFKYVRRQAPGMAPNVVSTD